MAHELCDNVDGLFCSADSIELDQFGVTEFLHNLSFS